ncbi:MAG: TonB-dependent siderophore receptor [Porticoccaceae bacterium]
MQSTITTNSSKNTARTTTLALAIHLACAGLAYTTATALPALWSGHANAQGGAASQARITFNIPPGPLSDGLNRFAEQAGIYLSGSGTLTDNKTSGGLQGEHHIDEGLQRLLQGTGLSYRFSDGKTVTLIKANDGPVTLSTVKVTDSAMNSATTEGTGSYATREISFGKGQSLREIPQSISVVTRQRIEDQNLTDLTEVLAQMTGVTMQNSNFSGASLFYSRGFEVNSFQYDGGAPTPGTQGYLRGFAGGLDMAMYDHVEVLRGADGLFSGAGEPGGVVNLVRKRPLSEAALRFSATAARWDDYRIEADVSRPLAFEGKLRGRLVGTYRDREYFFDTADMRTAMIYGVVEADLAPETVLTVGGSHQSNRSVAGYNGLPRYSNGDDIGLPRSRSFIADWNDIDNPVTQVFATLDHRISQDWNLKFNAMYSDIVLDVKTAAVSGAVDPDTLQGARWIAFYVENDGMRRAVDATLTGSFDAFGRTHKVRLGADHSESEFTLLYGTEFGTSLGTPPLDVFNPVAPDEPPAPALDHAYDPMRHRQDGVFGSLQLRLSTPLALILGGRYSRYEYVLGSEGVWGDSVTRYEDDGVFIPYGALLYDISEQWSAYGSVSETYVSQASSLEGPLPGSPLDPITGRNYEIGLKGELWEGRLNATFALYRIEREGQAVRDPDYPSTPGELGSNCCWLALGEQTSQGMDTEINGELLPGWQLFAGYTYNNNEDKQAATGRFSTITPKHLFKLFTTYRLPDTWSKWKVGGGITAQSSQFNRGTASTYNEVSGTWTGPSVPYEFTRGGYAIWSLHGEYQIDSHWSATLNINNLFDKTYYQTVGSTRSGNYYGEPLNWTLTLRGKF